MVMHNLNDLLLHELKDLYNAEKQLTKALPKIAKAVDSSELREAIVSHLEETQGHVDRLDRIFKMLGKATRGEKCEAMAGLIQEGAEIMEEEAPAEVLDAALIAAAQRVEHYEMAGYGCARAFADQLGLTKIAELLQETLDEEAAANERLNQIALESVNRAAMTAGAAVADKR